MSDKSGWGSYRPVVPEGTYLASSRNTEGAYRALLFEVGTNKLLGPPELSEVDDGHGSDALSDESESNLLGGVMALVIVSAGAAGVIKAAPHVKRWWNDRTFSGLRINHAGKEKLASPAPNEGSNQATVASLAAVNDTSS